VKLGPALILLMLFQPIAGAKNAPPSLTPPSLTPQSATPQSSTPQSSTPPPSASGVVVSTPSDAGQSPQENAPQPQTPTAPTPAAQPETQTAKPQTAPGVLSTPNLQAQRYIDLWNTGDFSHVDEMFDPHPTLHVHTMPLAMPMAMLQRRVDFWRKSMPDLNFKIEDMIFGANKVVLRLEYTGTYKDSLFPDTAPPSPKGPPAKVSASSIVILGLRDGKIKDIWEQYDELGMRLQMGGKWCAAEQATTSNPAPAKPKVKRKLPDNLEVIE